MRKAAAVIAISAAVLGCAAVAAPPAIATSPPVVTAVPGSEPSGGARGVVAGEGLAHATAVRVGGVLATIITNGASSITIQFPPHDPGPAHVRVTTAAGTSPATSLDVTYYTQAIHQTWTQTGFFDTVRGKMIDVSCPTDSFCAAIDDSRVVTYNGTDWQPFVGLTNADNLTAISCASASFCLVADSAGKVRTYNGTTWSRPKLVDTYKHPIADISCPLTRFCMAFDTHGIAFAFDRNTWAAPVPTGVTTGVNVSCAAANQCLAGGTGAASWDGTSWTVDAATPGVIEGIDCFSTTSCGVVLGNRVWLRNSGTWTLTPSPDVAGVACTSATSCIAVGTKIYAWNGTTWTVAAGMSVPHPFDAASCGPTACFAVDSVGQAWSNSTGSWGPHELVIIPRGRTTSVSCPSVTLCVASDDIGTVKTWDGTRWSDPVVIDPEFRGFLVSCPTTSFCMAVGGGRYQTWNGVAWSAPVVLSYPESFDCTSASFCLAVFRSRPKTTQRWTGSTWVADAPTPNGYYRSLQISCGSPTLCVTDIGLAWTPSGWETFDSPQNIAVSCATAMFCVGAGTAHVFFWRNGAWGTARQLSPLGSAKVDCVSASFCEVVDTAGHARVWNGSFWTDATEIAGLDTSDPLVSLSCAAPDKCVAVTADTTYESSSS